MKFYHLIFLTNNAQRAPSDTKNTFRFVKEFKRVSLVHEFLVFFDVTSLFINNHLTKTIKLAVDLTKTSQPDLDISKKILTRLI